MVRGWQRELTIFKAFGITGCPVPPVLHVMGQFPSGIKVLLISLAPMLRLAQASKQGRSRGG